MDLVKLITLLVAMKTANCFNGGAPFKMCSDAFPKHHGKAAQAGESPYTITLSKYNYSPSENLTVTIEGPAGYEFKGFTLSAKPLSGDPEVIAGSFLSTPSAAKGFSWPFVDGKANCLTHRDGVQSIPKLVVEWQAPATSVGDIVFWGAIVESLEVFWINVTSPVVTANVAVTPADYVAKPSFVFNPRLSMNECGRTKGCLLWPKYCSGYNCDYIVTFDAREDYIDFEMAGSADNYLSLGFSDDILMGGDETITCVTSDFRTSLQQGFNPGYYNDRLRADDISKVQIQYEDGYFYCRFRRPMRMEILHVHDNTDPPTFDKLIYNLKADYYAMIAWGHVAAGSNVIYKHKELPLVSPTKVNFQSTDIVYMDALPITIKAHAIMVIIAWIGLAGVAMIIGRHFRDGFGGKMSCGVKAWFQIHRLSLTLVFFLTAASFVLIFIKVGGWNDSVMLHAITGVAVMALLCFQLLLAMTRPDPSSPKRPVFTWVHRIAGKLNHACAAFSIMLGVNIQLLPKILIYRLTLLVAVWIGAQVIWEIIFEIIRWNETRSHKGFDTTISMDNLDSNGSAVKHGAVTAPKGNSLLKRFLLVLYFLNTAVFVALAVAFILLV